MGGLRKSGPKVELTRDDPTIFAKCPKCARRGVGVRQGFYYGSAFTAYRFARKPKCPNCRTRLVKLFEIETRKEGGRRR